MRQHEFDVATGLSDEEDAGGARAGGAKHHAPLQALGLGVKKSKRAKRGRGGKP